MPNLFASNPDLIVDPDKDYYPELVGEGKKYPSNTELARSRVEADAYIARLEQETSGLREELSTRLKYEDFLDKLKSAPLGSNQQPQIDDDPDTGKTAITEQELDAIVSNKLKQLKNEETANSNLNLVQQKLQEVYGPNYAQHLKRKTQELDMSESFVQGLAASNPKALFRLLEVDQETKPNLFSAPPKSHVTSTLPKGNTKGDSYYEKLRKEKPSEYWSPKVQNEIFEQIKLLGEAYYNS